MRLALIIHIPSYSIHRLDFSQWELYKEEAQHITSSWLLSNVFESQQEWNPKSFPKYLCTANVIQR